MLAPNPILALVLRHLLGHRGWRGGVARSVATTHLLDALAARHGCELHETPVGFKYLGDLITQGRAMFGGEESGGMSLRGHPPEKDGILACLLAAEVAAVEGVALGAVLERLYGGGGAAPVRPRERAPLRGGAAGVAGADGRAAGGARAAGPSSASRPRTGSSSTWTAAPGCSCGRPAPSPWRGSTWRRRTPRPSRRCGTPPCAHFFA